MRSRITVLLLISLVGIIGCDKGEVGSTQIPEETPIQAATQESSKSIALPFGKPEKNKKRILDKSLTFKPSGNVVTRLSVNSKSGSFIIRPKTEDLVLRSGVDIYRGDYEIVFLKSGNEQEAVVLDLLEDLEFFIYEEERSDIKNVEVLDFETFELVYFIPDPDRLRSNIYAYIIEDTGLSYPVHFEFAVDNQLFKERVFDTDNVHDKPYVNDQTLSILYGDGERSFYQLAFKPNLQNKALQLHEVKDISTTFQDARKMAEALVDVLARDWRQTGEKDINVVKNRFTDEAWNHKGFQYIYQNAPRSKQRLRLEFAVGVSQHIRPASSDVIRFKVSFNMLDIMNQMAYMDVEIRKRNDEWIFYKFGTVRLNEVVNNETHKKYNIHVGLVPGIYE